jgi:hypothetical protein
MNHPTKAHTHQPPRAASAHGTQPKGMEFVLGWLLLPVVLVCMAIYRWRAMKARMGYRTVRYD